MRSRYEHCHIYSIIFRRILKCKTLKIMVIKAALEELENSKHPIAKIMHTNGDCKTLVIVFKKGMMLKEHKTNTPATLVVIEGEVEYRTVKESVTLKKYNQTGITVGLLHEVEAKADSICLLIKG